MACARLELDSWRTASTATSGPPQFLGSSLGFRVYSRVKGLGFRVNPKP